MLNVTEIKCKQALNKINNPDLHQAWDLNLYRGCQHGCVYCFAIYSHDYLNPNSNYYEDIYVKINIVEQLEKQLSSPTWKKETIAIAGVTDCYQPIERKYKLMPEILKLMIKYKNPVSISTKSDLILRDYDLIDELSQVADVSINSSIVCMDNAIRQKIEPAGRNAKEKFKMLKAFSKINVTTGLLQMPIIPYLTDSRENIEDLYAHARDAEVNYIVPGMLYLQGKTRGVFFDFIKREFPQLFIPLTKLYQKGGRAEYKRVLYQMIGELRRKYRLQSWYATARPTPNKDLEAIKKMATGFQQLSLFEEVKPDTYSATSIPSKEQLLAKGPPEPAPKIAPPVNLNPFVEVSIGTSQPANPSIPIAPTPSVETRRDEKRARFYEMRQIARKTTTYGDHGKIFYEQAQFMKDFEDDYQEVAPFSSYFPYYQQMSYEQLRTYFTWRSQIRAGIIEPTSTSYAFLYIYELLNQIGVSEPTHGLNQLMTFWRSFRVFDPVIDPYVLEWLKDYHIYYPLPHSFKAFVTLNQLMSHYPTVFGYDSDQETSLNLFATFSKYEIKKSVFYTEQHQPMIHNCFYFVLSQLRTLFHDHGQCFEDFIFYPLSREITWIPFHRALFYPKNSPSNRKVSLTEKEVYYYESGKWRHRTVMLSDHGRQLVGYLMKAMEVSLRQVVKFKYKLTASPKQCDPVALEQLKMLGISFPDFIEHAVKAFYRQMTHKEVHVDMSHLGRIRQEALQTQEKLIIPEVEPVKIVEAKPPAKEEVANILTSTPWDALKTALTPVELEALALILQDQSLKTFARERMIMLEILVDGINEKAMDFIGDTLLELDDTVVLYKEYIENVAKMVNG